MTDLTITDHGSIFLVEPVSIAGHVWVGDNLPDEAATWGKAIVVEHRYIAAIVQGAIVDGLEVEGV